MPIEMGTVVEGVVTGITNFGAFIELPGGETGLVHISEIAEVYVKDVHDFLKTNDRVKVKVISVDPKGKIGRSIKQANMSTRPHYKKKFQTSFEDKLTKFMKESEERQQNIKSNAESKRGGRGARKVGTDK
jgi:S1 RNA binding domain protein